MDDDVPAPTAVSIEADLVGRQYEVLRLLLPAPLADRVREAFRQGQRVILHGKSGSFDVVGLNGQHADVLERPATAPE